MTRIHIARVLRVCAVVLAAAVVCIAAVAGVHILRERNRTGTDEERANVVHAAAALYAQVKATSTIELPEAMEWTCLTTVWRTGNGRPKLVARAALASPVHNGPVKYVSMTCDFDLISNRVRSFGMEVDRVNRDVPRFTPTRESRDQLVALAKAFAETNGDDEYEYRCSEVRNADMYELRVRFRRIVDGAVYLRDHLDITVAEAGFVTGYDKECSWTTLDAIDWMAETDLLERSRQLAEDTKMRGWQRTSDVRKCESSRAAGNPSRWSLPRSLSYVNDDFRSKPLFVSTWICEVYGEDPDTREGNPTSKAAAIKVIVSGTTGKLLRRDYEVVPSEEAEYWARRLLD